MKHRLALGQRRRLGELAAWFRAHRDALAARLRHDASTLEEQQVRRRESHSMEYGREAPEMRPYSELERSTAVGNGLAWEVTLEVAYWNRAEIASASLAVHYEDKEGQRISVTRHLRDDDRTDALEVEVHGVSDPEALLDWLRAGLAALVPQEASPFAKLPDSSAESRPEPCSATPHEGAHEVLLKESNVGLLDELRVGCGNFWPRRYTRADGSEAEGLCARLAPLDDAEALIVGQGSVFDLGGRTWEVIEVRKDANSRGHIRLRSATRSPYD